MRDVELVQDFVKKQRELRQKLIEDHRRRISKGEELDFVYFELYKELQEENAKLKKRNGELAGQKASLTRWFGEAKSIIRELMNTQPPLENVYDIGKFDIDDYGDAIAKAEAFLKE
ncbi:MAG: hypothetical protein J6P28_03165 [Treponema sp.]|nr:hypothetical protein [Treponema sp.]